VFVAHNAKRNFNEKIHKIYIGFLLFKKPHGNKQELTSKRDFEIRNKG
jgi:hypothetical protein